MKKLFLILALLCNQAFGANSFNILDTPVNPVSSPVTAAQGGTGTVPATTTPVTCTVGSIFFDTDATAGSNLYGCTAANTWTVQGGGGGLTVGTTTITSGTTLRLLFDNAGVLGETAVVTYVSPTLTITPTTAAGTVPALWVKSSGAGFVKLFDNGTVVIDSDSGSGTNPLLIKYNGSNVFTLNYLGIFTATGAILGGGMFDRINAGALTIGSNATSLVIGASTVTPATSGVRFLCISTAGVVTSGTGCVGT